MLYSLETIVNKTKKLNFIKKFSHIIKYQRYKSFSIENFLELLRFHIIDSIDLAQVFFFISLKKLKSYFRFIIFGLKAAEYQIF